MKRNVQKLELQYLEEFNGEIPLQLPWTMFISKTLVDLTLDGLISLKIPPSVWLPSLKMEDVRYENGDWAQKLIHGCLVLEYLKIYRGCESEEVLNISAPSLKHLVVTHLGDGDQFIVNTPELEYLDRTYYWAKDLSLENLSSLMEARINTGLSPTYSSFFVGLQLLSLRARFVAIDYYRRKWYGKCAFVMNGEFILHVSTLRPYLLSENLIFPRISMDYRYAE